MQPPSSLAWNVGEPRDAVSVVVDVDTTGAGWIVATVRRVADMHWRSSSDSNMTGSLSRCAVRGTRDRRGPR
jgi:hypothetical protein